MSKISDIPDISLTGLFRPQDSLDTSDTQIFQTHQTSSDS